MDRDALVRLLHDAIEAADEAGTIYVSGGHPPHRLTVDGVLDLRVILDTIAPAIRAAALEDIARLATEAGEERLDQAHAPLISGEALRNWGLAEVCNAHAEAGYTLIRFGEAIRALINDPPSTP